MNAFRSRSTTRSAIRRALANGPRDIADLDVITRIGRDALRGAIREMGRSIVKEGQDYRLATVADVVDLLGVESDAAVASIIDVSKSVVWRARKALGLPAMMQVKAAVPFDWTPWAPMFGIKTDAEIAALCGLSYHTVRKARGLAGIPARPRCTKPEIVDVVTWATDLDVAFGTMDYARATGLKASACRRRIRRAADDGGLMTLQEATSSTPGMWVIA